MWSDRRDFPVISMAIVSSALASSSAVRITSSKGSAELRPWDWHRFSSRLFRAWGPSSQPPPGRITDVSSSWLTILFCPCRTMGSGFFQYARSHSLLPRAKSRPKPLWTDPVNNRVTISQALLSHPPVNDHTSLARICVEDSELIMPCRKTQAGRGWWPKAAHRSHRAAHRQTGGAAVEKVARRVEPGRT